MKRSDSHLPPRQRLYAKLFALMEAIPKLERTGQMTGEEGQKLYDYSEAQETKDAFRAQLLKLRLMCLPKAVDTFHYGNPTTQGGTLNISQQIVTWEFTDVDTGFSETFQYSGEGCDPLDKGSPKASIQAQKYFLLNSFFVKCVDPLDGDSADEQRKSAEYSRQYLDIEGELETWHADDESGKIWLTVKGLRMWVTGKGIGKRMLKTAAEKNVKVRYYIGKLPPWENPVPLATELVICGSPNGAEVNPAPIDDTIAGAPVNAVRLPKEWQNPLGGDQFTRPIPVKK